MLLCTKCGETKPVDDFYREPRNTLRQFRRTQCKKCDIKKNKSYKDKNKEILNKKRVQHNRLKKAFFPPDLFDARLANQGGVCAICGAQEAGGRGQFHADHDHTTSSPRGILCHRCNIALGHFQDNPEILKAAIAYLEKYSEAK